MEIILIERENKNTIIDQLVQANLENSYCSKLYHLLKTGYLIKKMDICHFSDLSVDLKNCICQFS